jgi:hypothetical protein
MPCWPFWHTAPAHQFSGHLSRTASNLPAVCSSRSRPRETCSLYTAAHLLQNIERIWAAGRSSEPGHGRALVKRSPCPCRRLPLSSYSTWVARAALKSFLTAPGLSWGSVSWWFVAKGCSAFARRATAATLAHREERPVSCDVSHQEAWQSYQKPVLWQSRRLLGRLSA